MCSSDLTQIVDEQVGGNQTAAEKHRDHKQGVEDLFAFEVRQRHGISGKHRHSYRDDGEDDRVKDCVLEADPDLLVRNDTLVSIQTPLAEIKGDALVLQSDRVHKGRDDDVDHRNMIIARTYYQGIPRELREAADVDGASEMLYFFKILLPVCMPVVAVLALWQFVAMWNSYFDAMIYLNSASKQPLQLVLRSILIQSQPESGMIADIQSTAERAKMAELLKYATIIISSLPLLVMYPFFQKYFDAGIMAGSIKG